MGDGNEEYNLVTNSFSSPRVLGDPLLNEITSPRPRPTAVARATDDDVSVSPLRPRLSKAAAGNDFLAIMKMQMILDRAGRKEDRRLKPEEMREARREDQIKREEQAEDCQLWKRFLRVQEKSGVGFSFWY